MVIKAFSFLDQGACSNTQAACDDWAKQGYCDKKDNKKWMWKHCCSACVAGKNFRSFAVPFMY